MNLENEILEKPKKNVDENMKITSSSDILKLKDVDSIRNAIREYLLFIGLDSVNNVRNISVLGIGSSRNVAIDSKEIIRLALFSASDKVILIHNHPSNSINPSKDDLHITYVTSEILKPFNIELLDHIIVTEKDFLSMKKDKIMKLYFNEDKKLENMDKGLLIEENNKLKAKIEELEQNLNKSVEVLSAKYVGNYNDTTVYDVRIYINGKIDIITLERKYDSYAETDKWKVISDLILSDKEKEDIIQAVSKNLPTMFVDVPSKVYEDRCLDEIGMGE